MSKTNDNALLLTNLLLTYLMKAQEVGSLFAQANAEGRDVTDDEVNASGVAADAALLRASGRFGS